MRKWISPHPVSVSAEIRQAVGGYPLVSEILVRRGITDLEAIQAFLDPHRYTPASPYELDDMQLAVERLITAFHGKERICVWGDFDVDGQTATTLLVSTLRELGGVVRYHIPLRSKESHGVNLPVLKEIIGEGIDLLLTCDTGISAHQAVDFANSQGVDVILTDHHDLTPELPPALAVINPKRSDPGHPSANLPGVGVAYQLAKALFGEMDLAGGAEQYLDLVALGIVSDLALQRGDVRFLLQRGLARLRTPERLGLQVMMEMAEINPSGLTEEHIGFELAPRLNALGRLADANQAVEFLTTRDRQQARLIANRLEGLNAHRKLVTSQVFEAAQAQIDAEPSLLEHSALVLSHPSWPGGVIGIVASRLVERYHRPVLLITSPAGELARGSARSVPGIDISAAIAANQELLEGFGGHPMAAGFALQEERIPEFRRALSDTVSEMVSEISVEPSLQIDGDLSLADLTLELVTDLERLAPFGPGNPNPVFASGELQFRGSQSLGRSGDHLLVKLEDQAGSQYRAVWWGGGIEQQPDWLGEGAVLDLAYTARSRDYRGQQELQIEWLEARPVEVKPIEISTIPRQLEVVDHRQASHPLMELEAISRQDQDIFIWAEGQAEQQLAEHGIHSGDRNTLVLAEHLVVWTIPPSRKVLNRVVERVSPEVIYLFAVDPKTNEMKILIERLLGMAKFALNNTRGQVRISTLAAATAQREQTVMVGLQFLEARGLLHLQPEKAGQFCLSEGTGAPNREVEVLEKQLRELLEETAAYRRFFATRDPNVMLDLGETKNI